MDPKQVISFCNWLRDRGADVMEPTNEYEIVRFGCSFGVGVVYQNKKGTSSYNCGAVKETIDSWRKGTKWKYQGARIKNKSKPKPQLVARDGNECFYCGAVFSDEDLTIEHILSRTIGGVDKLANMVLACEPCNSEAGTLAVIDKILLRDKKRGYTA